MRALAVRSTDAIQVLLDYINAANAVARYAVQVNTTALPVLVTPPADYGAFADTLATAKGHAMAWIDEMVPAFTAIPSSILNLSTLVTPRLATIQAALSTLETNPDDQSARTAISDAIAALQGELPSCLTAVQDLGTWITRYSGTLQPDATALTSICADIAAAEQADQASIDSLKASLSNLQTLVAARNELATLDTIGNAVFSIVLAVAGVAVGVPFSGPAAVIVGLAVGVASAAFTAFVPIVAPPDYQQTLETLQTDMDSINTEIGAVNTIVGLLQATADQLTALVQQTATASAQVAQVLAFWQEVQADVAATAADLESILDDLADGGIPEAIAAFDAAQQSWSDLQAAMSPIAGMTYQVSGTIDLPPIHPPT